jgi:hypothetical protein
MLGNSWVSAQLAASEEGLSSMELAKIFQLQETFIKSTSAGRRIVTWRLFRKIGPIRKCHPQKIDCWARTWLSVVGAWRYLAVDASDPGFWLLGVVPQYSKMFSRLAVGQGINKPVSKATVASFWRHSLRWTGGMKTMAQRFSDPTVERFSYSYCTVQVAQLWNCSLTPLIRFSWLFKQPSWNP